VQAGPHRRSQGESPVRLQREKETCHPRIAAGAYVHIDIDHCASRVRTARKRRMSSSSMQPRNCFRLRTSNNSVRVPRESRMAPSRCARSTAIRDFDPGDSNALTRTLVSRTQRNYAPFRSESRTSGVSPRACALRRVIRDQAPKLQLSSSLISRWRNFEFFRRHP
jgi:hypothetical protein